jgi:hypothetical protein
MVAVHPDPAKEDHLLTRNLHLGFRHAHAALLTGCHLMIPQMSWTRQSIRRPHPGQRGAFPFLFMPPIVPCCYPWMVTEQVTGTWRNAERSGQRKPTRLSGIARRIENVRHTDVDLTQWCPQCKKPQVFAEVKSMPVPDAEWDQARRHAKTYSRGCIAILVIELPGDLGVRIYNPADDTLGETKWGEDFLVRVLQRARDRHECYE